MAAFSASLCGAQQAADRSAHIDLCRGVPLVRVNVNGRGPFSFIVDTGTSSRVILSRRLVKRLGLPVTGSIHVTDLSGSKRQALDAVTIDTLEVAGTQFRSVPAAVNNLPNGDNVFDGLLGFALFRDYLLTLDYPHRKLTLTKGSLAGSRDPNVLPLRMPGGIPVVPVSIAGNTADTEIDSGGLGLSLTAALAGQVKFAGRLKTVAYGRTQLSAFELRGGVMDGAVELGEFRFDEPWVEINPVFPLPSLGSAALQDFAVTFDQRSRLAQFSSASRAHSLRKPRMPGQLTPADELVGTTFTRVVY
jgi:predicted aspartyl protease